MTRIFRNHVFRRLESCSKNSNLSIRAKRIARIYVKQRRYALFFTSLYLSIINKIEQNSVKNTLFHPKLATNLATKSGPSPRIFGLWRVVAICYIPTRGRRLRGSV